MPGLYSWATILGKSNDVFGYCENPAIIFWKRTKGRNIKFWEHFFGRIGKMPQPLSPRRLVIPLVTVFFFLKYPVLCAIIIRLPFQKEPCPAQNTQEGWKEQQPLLCQCRQCTAPRPGQLDIHVLVPRKCNAHGIKHLPAFSLFPQRLGKMTWK